MNKYILTVIILLFSTGILFAQDNVKAVILDDKIKDINITDEFGNKIELDIEHSNLVEIDNTKYQQGLFHTKYVKNTSIDSWYDDFLSSSSVSVYSAKNAIGKAAYEMESQSVSNAFEDVLNLGYKYDSKKDTQLSCSDSFIKGDMYLHNKQYYSSYISSTRIFPVRNLAMAKAQEVILKDIENKGLESSEDIFFLALAEYVSDGLNNLPYIQEKINQLIAGGVSVDDMALYLSKYDVCNDNINKCNGIALFMSKIPLFKENDVADAFEIIRDNGLIEYAAFLNGYFNIFNDNVYEIVQVSKVNEQAVLNIFEINPPDKMYENLYPRYYKLISDDKSSGDVLTYTPQHCTDNVYFGNLYIFPYDNTTYIINATKYENRIIKIEVRSPKLFDTSYDNHYSIEPLIRTNSKAKVIENLVRHRVSSMDTFSYNDNVIYYQSLPRDYYTNIILDIERAYDIRGEKILPNKMKQLLNITKFDQNDYEKQVQNYIKYLQKYTKQKLIYNELYFYNIKSLETHKIILTAAYFYNQQGIKKEVLFLVDNKNLQIKDERETKKIDDIVSSEEYTANIIYMYNDIVNIGYIRNDNNIYLVKISNENKPYGEVYSIYDYKNIEEKINNISQGNNYSDDLLKLAGIDCSNIKNENDEVICFYRPLITAKAYAELLHKKKLEKAEKYYYPENIKKYINIVYKNMNMEYIRCERNFQCIMNTFLKYSSMLEYL